jgi:stage II sporulation protein D
MRRAALLRVARGAATAAPAALALAAALAALALAAAPPAGFPGDEAGATVEVLVLTRFHPRAATVDGPRALRLAADGAELRVDGRAAAVPLALEPARWTITLPDGTVRGYEAALRIGAAAGELRIVAALAREDYVARAVAAESLPGTPPAALEAQAVVARSFALAPGARHREAALCDLAHCQALTPVADAVHAEAARQAAEATRDRVLRLPSGAVARAVFHACCGGGTADPGEVFGGDDETGARAAPDPPCEADAWSVTLPVAEVEAAAGAALGAADPVPIGRLLLERDPHGRVRRLLDTATARWAAGDALARALDRTQDWSVVKSARFDWRVTGAGVRIDGRGHGHGVGLCQRGAARRARRGATAAAILEHYFAARSASATSRASRTPAPAGSAAPPRSAPAPTG